MKFKLIKFRLSISRVKNADALLELADTIKELEGEWKRKIQTGEMTRELANRKYYRMLKNYYLLERLMQNEKALRLIGEEKAAGDTQISLGI